MKKLLSVLALAGTATAAVAMTGCTQSQPQDTFFEPQVSMPIVYLEKNYNGFTDDAALTAYIEKFITVTFAKEYANTKATITVDASSIDLSKEDYYTVDYTVKYGDHEKDYQGFVSVVDRAVVMMKETSKIPAFKPSIAMSELAKYSEGITFETTGSKDSDQIDSIAIDDTTVRYAVPGTHLVKFAVTTKAGHTAFIYREVKILEAETATKTEFDKYFTYTDKGLACRQDAGAKYPEHLMIPSKYTDGDKTIQTTKLEQWGCDFKWNESKETGENPEKVQFRNVKSVTIQEGHTVLTDSYLALDSYNPEDNGAKDTPSIEKVFLPETLIEIQGSSHLAGTNVKSVVLPRSLKRLDATAYSNAWKLKKLVALSMPTTINAFGAFGANTAGAWFDHFTNFEATNKVVYFYIDYMMGTSNDKESNKQFADLWAYAKTSKFRYINSFVNYNKIILD